MRCFFASRNAVSNIFGFIIAFGIISTISTWAIVETTNVVNKSKHDVAGLEAQNVANQVADAMIDAATVSQSLPNARYYHILDLPQTLGSLKYYITVNEVEVQVSSLDGEVNKRSLNYNLKNLPFSIRGNVFGGEEGIAVSYTPPDFIYKLDFGNGSNVEEHSPVKSGYLLVTENSYDDVTVRTPSWWRGRKAEPNPGDYGGLCAFSFINGEPFIFVDNNENRTRDVDEWILDRDPDGDGVRLGGPGGREHDEFGALFAFDLNSEPYVFVDGPADNPRVYNWNYTFGVDEVIDLDIDSNGIIADPQNNDVGYLYALDTNGRQYAFKDTTPTNWMYDDGETVIKILIPGFSKYRIPIKIENTNPGAIDLVSVPVEIVITSNDINVFDIVRYGKFNCYFIDHGDDPSDPDDDVELPFCVDFSKEYDVSSKSWYFGSLDVFKEKMVFLVNVSMDAGATKYIYLYYGSDKNRDYHENDRGAVAEFYDDFQTRYGKWDRQYSRVDESGEAFDDVAYAIAKDSSDFFYVVGNGSKLNGSDTGSDWWIKKFDVNGYDYTEDAVAGSGEPGWNLSFDGNGGDDTAYSVATYYSASVYVVGSGTNLDGGNTGKDWWIKRFTSNGTEFSKADGWNKTFDGNGGDDVARSVFYYGYRVYVVGYGTNLNGSDTGKDWWIKKFYCVGSGNEYWDKTFDGNGGDDEARSITVDSHGNVYVVGYGTNLNGSTGKDWWIMRFNGTTGNRDWNKTFDGNSGDDEALSVAVEEKYLNDVYVVGYGTNLNGSATGKDWWIKKFNETGVEYDKTGIDYNWNKTFDGKSDSSRARDDVAYSVFVEKDIDKNYIDTEWRYDTGELIDDDPDRDTNLASLQDHKGGGLYARNETGEYYIFQDDGDWISEPHEWDWELREKDADNNGTDAVPQSSDFCGLLAYNNGMYIFRDNKTRNWRWDSDEQYYKIDDTATPTEGDLGGFVAFDDDGNEIYTFRDKNEIYVAGYTTNLENESDWWLKKFNPGGVENTAYSPYSSYGWNKTYSSGGNSSAHAIALDRYANVYFAGNGTNLSGVATTRGKDWWIHKFQRTGSSAQKTTVNPEKWSMSHVPYISRINTYRPLKLERDYYIISKDYSIPDIDDDDLYVVEMKLYHYGWWGGSSPPLMRLVQSGLILLSQGDKENYDLPDIYNQLNAYVFSIRDFEDLGYSNLSINKSVDGISTMRERVELPYFLKAAGNQGEHLIVRSYIYKDSSDAMNIKSYLYHPSTNSPYIDNISFIDNDFGAVYDNGRIGIGSFYRHWSSQHVKVEWIRVRKVPSVPPIVTVGVVESTNYGWKWPDAGYGTTSDTPPSPPSSENRNPDVFCTDPLYYDFVDVPIRSEDDAQDTNNHKYSEFIIHDLSEGRYTVSITTGDVEQDTAECWVNYRVNLYSDFNEYDFGDQSILLPGTVAGQFNRIWFIVQIPERKAGNIHLIFYHDRADPSNNFHKPISSITVEKQEEGFEKGLNLNSGNSLDFEWGI